ncbi:hypothetical protein [Halosimplex sp. TS25]|uniref:hypothetical protein n=1 Tax=Halosimplex rarum TaxID=3396619 RepID=UPI0039E8D538
MPETRRNALKRGGAAIAVLSSLGGCLGVGGGGETDRPEGNGGSDGSDGAGSGDTPTETPTPSGTPTATPIGSRPETPVAELTKWMPGPSAIDQSGYAFMSMAPRAMLEFEGTLGSDALEGFDQSYPLAAIDTMGDAAAIHRFARSASVIEAEFDRTPVEDDLRDLGFTAGEARHGFRIFSAEDARAAAVRNNMLVTVGSFSSRDTADKTPVVEAIVDARTGNSERYVDAVADCDRLVETLGSAHLLQGRTHEAGETFAGGVGEGMGYHVESEQTRVHAAVAFAEEETDRSLVADWASESDAFLGGSPTVRSDGRVVTATALVATGEVTEFPAEFPGPDIESESSAPPAVSFGFDYAETGDGVGTVTITHDSGETVDSDALFVRGTGFATVDGADQTSAGPWQGSASGDEGSVVAGDSVAVGVANDYEVSVVWEPSSGDTSAVLATHEGPNA